MSRIPLRPSWLLAALLALVHAGSAVCAFVFIPAPAAAWLVGAFILASLGWHLRLHALLLSPDSPAELAVHADGRLELRMRNGEEHEGRVTGSTFVSPLLIVVAAKMDTGRKRGIVLLSDSASTEDRRALRVRLRHGLQRDLPQGPRPGASQGGDPDSTRV